MAVVNLFKHGTAMLGASCTQLMSFSQRLLLRSIVTQSSSVEKACSRTILPFCIQRKVGLEGPSFLALGMERF
jgi:hypothetical protein